MVLPDAEAHVISCYGLECEEAFAATSFGACTKGS